MTPAYSYAARVLRVIDADTYDVEVDVGFRLTTRLPLRLAFVDAPEARTAAGDAATAWVRELFGTLPRPVVVRTYKPTDSFGRYLAELFLPDGRSLADELLAAGHAETRR